MEQSKLKKITSSKSLLLFGALGALALFLCVPRNTVIISIGNLNVTNSEEVAKEE